MRTVTLLAAALICATTAGAVEDWPVKLSETSSRELAALHETLLAPRLEGTRGVPVSNLSWKVDALEIRIQSGAVFLEPPVEGVPVGAFFVGTATAHFNPASDEQRRKLAFWFGQRPLDGEPVTSAYFFTLRGADLLAQLGATGDATVPFEAREAYVEAKQALRRRGLDTVDAFLNRDGRARGTALAIAVAPGVRVDESRSALLMLRHDPGLQEETGVEVYGHASVASKAPRKFLFTPVVQQQAAAPRFVPQGDAVAFRLDVTLGTLIDSAEESATISLRPAPGLRAIRLALTAWMQVASVKLGNERDLPFLQWKRDPSGEYLDETLLVDLGSAPGPGATLEIVVRSEGTLFEPWGQAFYLVDEDAWYPDLPDARNASYDVSVTLPADRVAVAPGRLVERKSEGDRHRYLFRTTRPQKASSVYVGKFQWKSGVADGTKIEVYAGKDDKNLDFAVTEMQNIMKVFNRVFLPLELETLRVAGAPIAHGRGFDGLLILSRGAAFDGSSASSDLFRAHEAAHQWWGNVVQPDRWPRDRWLSESFAEYASMEYFRARFEDAKKTREAIHREWVLPLQRSPEGISKDLRGKIRDASVAELWALLDGRQNVYTKWPMVLQMFRYLCKVKTGGDEAFWEIQRTFLKEFSGKPATTEDFVEVSQRVLGTDLRWFWSQWLLRTEIPKVRWTSRVEPKDGKWLLTVDATQVDTDFTLLIPVYAHFGGGKVATQPLVTKGKAGRLQMMLPQEPEDVTLNDNWEALVELVK